MRIEILPGPAVHLDLSADDWSLNAANSDEEHQERDYAALDINKDVEQCIMKAQSRDQFQLGNILLKYSKWGAQNGLQTLNQILDQVYGKEV